MKRKINIFLAFLFIVSALMTSLHEMMPEHDESTCEVCTLVQHDSGLVPEAYVALSKVTTYYTTIPHLKTQKVSVLISTTNPRAPPLFS